MVSMMRSEYLEGNRTRSESATSEEGTREGKSSSRLFLVLGVDEVLESSREVDDHSLLESLRVLSGDEEVAISELESSLIERGEKETL